MGINVNEAKCVSSNKDNDEKVQSLSNQEGHSSESNHLERCKQQLEEILRLYDPSKIQDVDVLLQNYAGMEEELIQCYLCYYTNQSQMHELKSTLTNQQEHNGKKTWKNKIMMTRPSITKLKASFSMRNWSNKQCERVNLKPDDDCIESRRNSNPECFLGEKLDSKSKNEKSAILNKFTKMKISSRFKNKKPGFKPSWRPQFRRRSVDLGSFKVKCLDTGESISANKVNNELLKSRKTFRMKKRMTFRDKLIAFFKEFDPDQIDKIDEILGYGGYTNENLWNDLQAKYEVNQRERLHQIFRTYKPSKLKDIDKLLNEYAGQEENLIYQVREKYMHKNVSGEKDECTWKAGASNSYQLLPCKDLGD